MDELNVTDDFWIEVMQEFDQNEDGHISYQEFKDCLISLVDRHSQKESVVKASGLLDSDIMSDDSMEPEEEDEFFADLEQRGGNAPTDGEQENHDSAVTFGNLPRQGGQVNSGQLDNHL